MNKDDLIKKIDHIMDQVHPLITACDNRKNHDAEGFLRKSIECLLGAKIRLKGEPEPEPEKPTLIRRRLL